MQTLLKWTWPALIASTMALSATQSYAETEYQLQSVGKSAHVTLRQIAEQAKKEIVLNVPDKILGVNISADTAYSAARQVTANADYNLHYQDDTFTVYSKANEQPASQALKLEPPEKPKNKSATFSLTLRDTPIQEAFEMLAKKGRINLLVAPDVTGTVSANLYDIDLNNAVDSVAKAAGLLVERSTQGTYIRNSTGPAAAALQLQEKEVQSFKIQYSDITSVETIMREYLSEDGTLTVLDGSRMIIVRDNPDVLKTLGSLLKIVDMQPRQILIEAKILEITLTDEETYGIDWQSERGDGTFGTLSLANRDTAGFFLNVMGNKLNAYLSAISKTGRVRTLSTPKLLVLEDQDAEVVVGNKIGFKVVSTTGSTTTESVEFLESGIILRVKASVDSQNRIMLDVHPEVSTGELADGLPVQNTTEVTTNLLARSGDEIFIGGLIRSTATDNESGVPGISRVPVVGNLFKKSHNKGNRTETVVIIKPRIVEQTKDETEPLAELLDSDDWFYQKLPHIDLVSGCVNNHCVY